MNHGKDIKIQRQRGLPKPSDAMSAIAPSSTVKMGVTLAKNKWSHISFFSQTCPSRWLSKYGKTCYNTYVIEWYTWRIRGVALCEINLCAKMLVASPSFFLSARALNENDHGRRNGCKQGPHGAAPVDGEFLAASMRGTGPGARIGRHLAGAGYLQGNKWRGMGRCLAWVVRMTWECPWVAWSL